MTNPPPPITDEDLSAVLDGEADVETIERVQADPAARARLEAFRVASHGLGARTVTPLPAHTVDQLIGRALAEAEAPSASTGPPSSARVADPDEVVTPLAPPRRKGARVPSWLVAAAVVVLVAIGLGLVWAGTQRNGDDDLASSSVQTSAPTQERSNEDRAAEDGAASGGNDSSQGEAPGAALPGSDPTSVPGANADPSFGGLPLVDLGRAPNLAALREAVAEGFPAGAPTVTDSDRPSPEAVTRCGNLMMQIFELEQAPRAVGLAQVGSQTLLVYNFEAPSVRDGRPTTFVTANDLDSCDAAFTFEREPN